MDAKYYTPDISEFHVGFEYEHCHSSIRFVMLDLRTGDRTNETEPKEIWEKSVFTGNEFDVWKSSFKFDDSLRDGQIRVKYLDKEDIESFGFKCEEEDVLSTLYSQFNRRFSMLVDNRYFIHIGMITLSDRVILTIDTSVYENSEKTKVIHSIRIKNKSELKQILKMIGYENSMHS